MTPPYQNWATVAPAFQMMLEPCMRCLSPITSFFIRLRWMMAHSFAVRLIPKALPVIDLPYVRSLFYLTIGDLLLFQPLLFLAFSGYNKSYVNPDLDRSGQLASIAIYLTVLTAQKSNNLFSFVLGIPFDRLIPYHMLCSMIAVMLGFFHTVVAYEIGGANGTITTEDSAHASFGMDPDLSKFLRDGKVNLTGTVLLASLTVSVILSIVPVRRFFFQFWLYSHIIAALTAIVVCFLHNVTTVVFILLWSVIDWSVRYMIMPRKYRSTVQMELLPGSEEDRKVVELTFVKPQDFAYAAGQFVRVAIPVIAHTQFHPASIASAPHDDKIVLRFRGRGDWTNKLARLAEFSDKHTETDIIIEGPYGALSVDLDDHDRYKTVLIVAGGVGSTHCDSVANDLLYKHQHKNRPLTKLRYVWSVPKLDVVPDEEEGENPLNSSYDTHATIAVARVNSSVSMEQHGIRQDKMQMDIYGTRENLGNDSDGDDAESGTVERGRNIHRGLRPDYDSILQELKAVATDAGEKYVAVIVCGPNSMVESLRDSCRRHSDTLVGCNAAAVTFDVHSEAFEY